MNTPPQALASIRDRLADAPEGSQRFLWGATAGVCLDHVLHATSLGGRVAEVAGRSVLIATRDQFAAVLALIELDGIARRLIVCTPDLPSEHLPAIVAQAGVDAIVSDHDRGDDGLGVPLRVLCHGAVTEEFGIRNEEFGIRNSEFRRSGCSSPPARPARRKCSFTASPA